MNHNRATFIQEGDYLYFGRGPNGVLGYHVTSDPEMIAQLRREAEEHKAYAERVSAEARRKAEAMTWPELVQKCLPYREEGTADEYLSELLTRLEREYPPPPPTDTTQNA